MVFMIGVPTGSSRRGDLWSSWMMTIWKSNWDCFVVGSIAAVSFRG